MALKVGIAPGTTTLHVPAGGQPTLVGYPATHAQQDPGVHVRNAYGQLSAPRYFDARPTDFELSKIYGYTPVHRGWISGQLGGGCGPCGMGQPCAGLGQDDPRANLKVGMSLGAGAVGAAVGAVALHGQGAAWSAAGAGALGAILGYIGYRIASAPLP